MWILVYHFSALSSGGYKEMSSVFADHAIASSYARGRGVCGVSSRNTSVWSVSGLIQWVQLSAMHITWHGTQINFGDLPPYLTYDWTFRLLNSKTPWTTARTAHDLCSSLLFEPMSRMWRNSEPEFPKEPRNRFQGINSASLCSVTGRYDNPIPTRFLAPINCFKILAQVRWGGKE